MRPKPTVTHMGPSHFSLRLQVATGLWSSCSLRLWSSRNHVGRYGTALAWAAQNGREAVVQLLLQWGFRFYDDPILRTIFWRAYRLASDCGHHHGVMAVLEKYLA